MTRREFKKKGMRLAGKGGGKKITSGKGAEHLPKDIHCRAEGKGSPFGKVKGGGGGGGGFCVFFFFFF